MPRRMLDRGERAVSTRPSSSTVPSHGSAPKMARAISVRPLPTRPASPTISPARTLKEMSSKAGGRLSPRTERTTGASAGGGFGVGKATSSERPSIAVTSVSEVSSEAASS